MIIRKLEELMGIRLSQEQMDNAPRLTDKPFSTQYFEERTDEIRRIKRGYERRIVQARLSTSQKDARPENLRLRPIRTRVIFYETEGLRDFSKLFPNGNMLGTEAPIEFQYSPAGSWKGKKI